MHFIPVFATALALASPAVASPTEKRTWWHKDTGLANAMRQRGRSFIGSALTIRNDTAEQNIIKNIADFNSITPENAMKWESIEPSRNNFTFADADRYAAYARENQKQLHCHTLVWHSQLPAWVSNGNFTADELIGVMKNHIYTTVKRYKGYCTRWDVVNEALNENGTYRSSVWYDTLGERFIPLAFQFTHEADPHAQLYYNDYNLEYAENKTAGAARIVELVQKAGLKIDGVGFQAHLASEATPTAPGATPEQAVLESALRTMTSRGVNVIYTEVDVRMNTPATPEKLQTQKENYNRIAKSCLAVRRCVGMTAWGVSDRYSWIPDTFPGEGAALMWNENYQKKLAYYGFYEGIRGY